MIIPEQEADNIAGWRQAEGFVWAAPRAGRLLFLVSFLSVIFT
jgi:hypothetical protein